MLKQLHIQNIILIEREEITFEAALNVLTGETGSGKSAIMEALTLILGERADASIIRKGCEKGTVEAVFDIEHLPEVNDLLNEAGIEHDNKEDLIIRREISTTGKSRSLINHQMAHLTLLRKLATLLIDIVGQHANQRLLSLDYHRQILDSYGSHEKLVKEVQKAWEEKNQTRQELEHLINDETTRLREIENAQRELEELESTNMREGEEEELFAEYTLFAGAEERAQQVNEITKKLSEERECVITTLNQQKALFDRLVSIDPSLDETAQLLNNALIELQEVVYILKNYHSRIEHNPDRMLTINERLGLINRLKRKYGQSVQEVLSYQEEMKKRLEKLENRDIEIEALKDKLQKQEQHCHELCHKLTETRKATAANLEKALLSELQDLNMSKAEFRVAISPQERNATGDDKVEFFIAPNIGESLIPIRECASGGELARIMLAIQTLLAGKEKTPIIVFDEIDASIGGETASIVGEKLAQIGTRHQVFCITHFPQVAKHANHHLQITKEERNGRTLTFITPLDTETKKEELTRMLGGSVIYN